MKAIKYCKWKIHFIKDNNLWYWSIETEDNCGLDYDGSESRKTFKTEKKARDNFQEFIELNEIENYFIVD